MIVLEQQRGRLCVIFTRCDVQRWEADFSFSVVLQQQGDHRVVALLESNGQGSEAILEEQRGKRRRDKLTAAITFGKGVKRKDIKYSGQPFIPNSMFLHTNIPLLQCFGSLHFPEGIAQPRGDSPELPCRVG